MLAELWNVIVPSIETLRQIPLEGVKVSTAIGPLAMMGIGLGTSVLTPILLDILGIGGPSRQEEEALRVGTEAGRAQADQLRQQTELRRFLEAILRGDQAMPRSQRPGAFQFSGAAGETGLDPNYLASLIPAISPEMEALLGLAGMPSGASAANTLTGIGAGLGAERRGNVGSLTESIIQMLLAGDFGGGRRNSSAAPFTPEGNFAGRIPDYFIPPDLTP